MLQEVFSEGELEVYHPRCRTRVLLLEIEVRRSTERPYLAVEGICQRCGCYVHLRFHAEASTCP